MKGLNAFIMENGYKLMDACDLLRSKSLSIFTGFQVYCVGKCQERFEGQVGGGGVEIWNKPHNFKTGQSYFPSRTMAMLKINIISLSTDR